MMLPVMPTQSSDGYDDDLKLHRTATFGEVSFSPDPTESTKNPPIAKDGTAFAINYPISGTVGHSPLSGVGRGGARNHADRESHGLSLKHVRNLIDAARHADDIGLPLTRTITIHWEEAGLPLDAMAKATGQFIGLMTKAIVRHRGKTAWIWVHEGGEREGGHCHILAHVPADLVPVLRRLQMGWLHKITGRKYRPKVIQSKPIGKWLGIEESNPNYHATNLEAMLVYVLKGANPEAALQFGLTRLKSGGRIIGKRCGTSQNIGAKARSVPRT